MNAELRERLLKVQRWYNGWGPYDEAGEAMEASLPGLIDEVIKATEPGFPDDQNRGEG